jgi:hypothetical protein
LRFEVFSDVVKDVTALETRQPGLRESNQTERTENKTERKMIGRKSKRD